MFPLSLTGIAFSWFASLAPSSINSWFDLEKKFHEHFFSGYNELKLSHLTSVKRCFNVFIVEKDLVHLASNGLHSYFKEKLGSFDFFSVNQVMQLALATKSQNKTLELLKSIYIKLSRALPSPIEKKRSLV